MREKIYQNQFVTNHGVLSKEDLPLPYVIYPGYYGTFFAFKESEHSPACFCACSMEAIQNCMEFNAMNKATNSDPTRNFILDSFFFPKEIVKQMMQKNVEKSNDILRHLKFRSKLCHECNKTIPKYKYCHEKAGIFKAAYGWYIMKQGFEYGVDMIWHKILIDKCPQDVLDVVDIDPNSLDEQRLQILGGDPSNKTEHDIQWELRIRRLENISTPSPILLEFEKNLRKQERRINNLIEDEVRRKFGHKKIGEAWTSETILYYMVKQLFPDYKIHRHFKPDFLQGLELDIYIKELNLGIEYQGLQHYKPVKHWGGLDGLKRLQERDKKKKKLCKIQGVTLIYFEYDETLTDQLVKNRVLGVKNR